MGSFEPKGQGGGVGSEAPIECNHGELGDSDCRRWRYDYA